MGNVNPRLDPSRPTQPPAEEEASARARAGEARADDDAASADVTRRLLRSEGVLPIEPDDRIASMLVAGEQVVAVRRGVSLERRKLQRDPDEMLSGDLYVTTRRLVYLGREPLEYALGDIREAVIATGALRLVVGEGLGVEIRVPDPCLLRVELGAVREAERASMAGAVSGAALPGAPGQPQQLA
jgi:hypothetical protein